MTIYWKKDLLKRTSDYKRKGWTNAQVNDLINSLWRDPESPRTSGFDIEGGTDSSISAEITSSTIEGLTSYFIYFSISPVGKKFSFYQYRTKLSFHKKFAEEHLEIPASEGIYVIYYEWDNEEKDQVLTYVLNPTQEQILDIFEYAVPITYIYYNADTHEIIYFGDNRHGSLWNPWMHYAWHQTFNSMRETGLEFTDLVADGDGSSDTHAQFGVSAGSCFHEDIYATALAQAAPADFPVWYFIAGDLPRIHSGSTESLVVDGLLCYNTGGAVVPATEGYFVMYHIFFTNDTLEPFISVMGQEQYDKVSMATLMMSTEVQQVKDLLPHQNLLHIGSLIFQTSAAYGNMYKSRIVNQVFGDFISDVFVEDDVQFPIEYLKYTKNGADTEITQIMKPNGLVYGGRVIWVELLNFSVSPAICFIAGELYMVRTTTSVTLDAADATYDRIDLIVFNSDETITKITGTPAASPVKPQIDPETQIELTSITVKANATEPEGITTEQVYDENTEWTGFASGVTVDFNNATSPFHLLKCASVGSIENNDYVSFQSATAKDIASYANLVLYIKLKAAMTNQHNIYLSFYKSGKSVSNEKVISLNKSDVTNWQAIIIPLSQFGFSESTVDELQIRWSKTGANTAHNGFYLDFIKLETGIIQQVINTTIKLTGDVTGEGQTGSPVPTTLATVNSNVGSFGSATKSVTITVDAKGRITAVTENDISGGTDEKVKLSADDATAGYLTAKLDGVDADTVDDADTFNFVKVATSVLKKITWANIMAKLKTYFDTLYQAAGSYLTDAPADGKTYGRKDAAWSEVVGGGGGANTALSNLVDVAINTSLISDTDSTYDLGSSAKYWANLYVDTIYTPAINGGATANDDITIQGTTDATRTTSYVILQPNGGNVGIGNSTPLVKLDLGLPNMSNSILKAGGLELISYDITQSFMTANCYFNGTTWKYRGAASTGYWGIWDSRIWIETAPAGNAGDTVTWSDVLILRGTWTKMAIGNYTPVTRLDLGASVTNNSILKAGSFEVQSYDIHYQYLFSNAYYNFGFKYRASSAPASCFALWNGGVQVGINSVNGTAGNAISFTCPFKITGAGAIGIGGAMTLDNEVFTNARIMILATTGYIGVGTLTPTAILHIKAGTATASTAPLKFTSGTLLSSPEAGAVEFLTDTYYVTISTGTARKGIITDDGARLTSGKIPIASTGGRLIDGQTPLAGTKTYYVADSSEGAATRKLTFIDGILTSET